MSATATPPGQCRHCYTAKLGPIRTRTEARSTDRTGTSPTHPGTYENIGYGLDRRRRARFPYINSGHPGGFNVTMCDGSVHYITNQINGTVWAKLVTSAGSKLPPAARRASAGLKQLPVTRTSFHQRS